MSQVFARALREHVRRVQRDMEQLIQLAEVISMNPLRIDLMEGRATLDEDEVTLTQWARRYHNEYIIAPGDTVVLVRKRTGGDIHWVLVDVLSDEDASVTAGGVSADDLLNAILAHSNDTTNVHGIPDTTLLATDTDVAAAVSAEAAARIAADAAEVVARDAAVSAHDSDTTNVHGIPDTSVLATATSVAAAVSAHEADTTNVHGIADTADLATIDDAIVFAIIF